MEGLATKSLSQQPAQSHGGNSQPARPSAGPRAGEESSTPSSSLWNLVVTEYGEPSTHSFPSRMGQGAQSMGCEESVAWLAVDWLPSHGNTSPTHSRPAEAEHAPPRRGAAPDLGADGRPDLPVLPLPRRRCCPNGRGRILAPRPGLPLPLPLPGARSGWSSRSRGPLLSRPDARLPFRSSSRRRRRLHFLFGGRWTGSRVRVPGLQDGCSQTGVVEPWRRRPFRSGPAPESPILPALLGSDLRQPLGLSLEVHRATSVSPILHLQVLASRHPVPGGAGLENARSRTA